MPVVDFGCAGGTLKLSPTALSVISLFSFWATKENDDDDFWSSLFL